jgi:acetyl-CoA C-acetyltransferase
MSAHGNKCDWDSVIVAMARTAFGRFGGALKEMTTAELGAAAIDAVLARAGVEPRSVSGLYAGVGMIGAGVLTPARRMVLQSRLSETTPSMAVDRACCSGITAIGLAMRALAANDAGLLIAGGAENLSSTPRLLPRETVARPGPLAIEDPLALRAPFLDKAIARYTGEEALAAGIDRHQQDEWAVRSHHSYFAAAAKDVFSTEIAPLEVLAVDEGPRSDCTLERLTALKTVYDSPTVTAGNAPGLNDGAAFIMLASRATAERQGLPVLARLRAHAQVAGGATTGTSTPAVAIAAALSQADVALDGIDLIEINEAFAATPLVSTLRLADGDERRAESLRQRTNVQGGAVAIGHPLGASGARLVMTLANALRRRGGGRGVAAICGGYGQGDAIVVEVEG